MRRVRLFSVICIALILFPVLHASADLKQCLDPGKTADVTRALQELLHQRQRTWRIHDPWLRDPYREANSVISNTPFSADDSACLGLDVRFKRVPESQHETIRGSIISAFLLLDESLHPRALRDADTRPEYLHKKIGRVIKVIDRYRAMKYLAPNVAGSFNPWNKHISLPVSSFKGGWIMFPFWYQREGTGETIMSSHGFWDYWQCGAANGEGSLGVIIHEYGHDLDFALHGMLRRGKFSSRSVGWKKLHKQEFVSPYGDTSLVEDFAESFTAYFLDPLMKCYAPRKYAWFSQFARANKEIYGSELPYESLDCDRREHRELLKRRALRAQAMRETCAP